MDLLPSSPTNKTDNKYFLLHDNSHITNRSHKKVSSYKDLKWDIEDASFSQFAIDSSCILEEREYLIESKSNNSEKVLNSEIESIMFPNQLPSKHPKKKGFNFLFHFVLVLGCVLCMILSTTSIPWFKATYHVLDNSEALQPNTSDLSYGTILNDETLAFFQTQGRANIEAKGGTEEKKLNPISFLQTEAALMERKLNQIEDEKGKNEIFHRERKRIDELKKKIEKLIETVKDEYYLFLNTFLNGTIRDLHAFISPSFGHFHVTLKLLSKHTNIGYSIGVENFLTCTLDYAVLDDEPTIFPTKSKYDSVCQDVILPALGAMITTGVSLIFMIIFTFYYLYQNFKDSKQKRTFGIIINKKKKNIALEEDTGHPQKISTFSRSSSSSGNSCSNSSDTILIPISTDLSNRSVSNSTQDEFEIEGYEELKDAQSDHSDFFVSEDDIHKRNTNIDVSEDDIHKRNTNIDDKGNKVIRNNKNTDDHLHYDQKHFCKDEGKNNIYWRRYVLNTLEGFFVFAMDKNMDIVDPNITDHRESQHYSKVRDREKRKTTKKGKKKKRFYTPLKYTLFLLGFFNITAIVASCWILNYVPAFERAACDVVNPQHYRHLMIDRLLNYLKNNILPDLSESILFMQRGDETITNTANFLQNLNYENLLPIWKDVINTVQLENEQELPLFSMQCNMMGGYYIFIVLLSLEIISLLHIMYALYGYCRSHYKNKNIR